MGFEFRPDGDLARRERDELIDHLAATHGLDVRVVQELFAAGERAAREDPRGRSAVHWFERLAGLPSDPDMPAPGRRTAVQAAYGTGGHAGVGRRAVVSPGKRTRTMTLAAELTRSAQQASRPQPLESSTRARMSELLGADFSRVRVHADSDEATGSVRAIARGDEIHFREGAYQPGTQEGDRLIAHELAHVIQQGAARGGESSRRKLEQEADWAAARVARGQPARVQLRAAAGAYAYSDAEDHDDVAEPDVQGEPSSDAQNGRGPESGEEAQRGGAASAESQVRPEREDARTARESAAPEQAALDEDAGPTGNTGEAAEGGDLRGELQDVGAPLAESGDGGAPSAGGGGGSAPRPVKEAPSVAGARPETALGQLRGVRPDKQAEALPDLKTAASADVDKTRGKAQANPPKQLSTGERAAPSNKGGKPGAEPDDKGGPTRAPKDPADHAIKTDLPEDRAAKQAAQAEAAQAQKNAGQAIQDAAQSGAIHFQSLPSGKAAEGDADKMSDADAQAMAGSIDRLSADVSNVNTDAGPPPTIEMKGEAKSSADRDRADLEGKAQNAETQARADSRVPMGEDSIETTVQTEELTAQPIGGQVPDVPLPTVAGMASSEEVGIIAQEQHQSEIDAALGKASGDVAGERAKHEQADAQARLDTDRQIGQLKTQADGEQEGARQVAHAEVDRARGEWQGEVDKKGADARAKADKTIADGMADVETEEEKANQESKKHVEEGKKKADEEKKKGEQEAEEAKKKGEEKSSGFWGWVKSKAKALVDGIKKAITAVIDLVRKAVKTVIDAAKKLAMAAIELARKAIVAVIQAIGKALLAITDVLLAAFPELKAKFQRAIRGMVDKAVNAVNKLAEGLKKAVQKALDLLGAALDKALGLLEKGLHFIVDAAGAVIQAAIKAAEALASMLGVWAKLIVDVATSPGSWISKLAAAVVDGIKNHLWAALKTAVLAWFQSKVFELLGLGGVLLQILLDGGMTTQDITEMALQALIVAIPVILVTILVEKLVSMIVPAAGAVIAIIEGLIAAWGTISRIIAAFAAFVAFLLAVKGGGAGPLFAGLLAAAAVVVLDFVANWLLRRLAGPARKVGDKLKKLAEKFKNRRKPKRPGQNEPTGRDRGSDKDGPGPRNRDADEDRRGSGSPGKDRDRDAPGRPNKHTDKEGPDGKRKSGSDEKAEKDKKNRDRLDKAIRVLQPKVASLLQRGVSKHRLRGQLLVWRAQYRLTALRVEGPDSHPRVIAKVNPEGEVQEGLCLTRNELLTLARKVSEREVIRRQSAVPEAVQRQLDIETPRRGHRSDHEVGIMPDGTPLMAREYQQQGHSNAMVYGELDGKRMDIGTYAKIHTTIKDLGMTDAEFARHMTSLIKTGKVSAELASNPRHAAFAGALKKLMVGREATRNPMALLTGPMALELVASGSLTWKELFTGQQRGGGADPMSMKGAPRAARKTYDQLGLAFPVLDPEKLEKRRGTAAEAEELQEREKDMLLRWLNEKAGQQNLVFKDKQTAEIAVTRLLIELCREWYGKKLLPPNMTRR